MSIHPEPHPLARQTVTLNVQIPGVDSPAEFYIEDYWDRVSGGSWMTAQGNPAALNYAMRSGLSGLPLDNEVLYGKVGAFGHLVHVSEIEASA